MANSVAASLRARHLSPPAARRSEQLLKTRGQAAVSPGNERNRPCSCGVIHIPGESTENELRTGQGREHRRVRRAQHLATASGDALEHGDEGQCGVERQCRLRFIEAIDARIVESALDERKERFAVAHLVEGHGIARRGVVFEVGVERMHGHCPKEETPAVSSDATLQTEPVRKRRLAQARAMPRVAGSTLGREPVSDRDALDQGRLAAAVSPTRNVTPGSRSSPSRSTWATAGIFVGQPKPGAGASSVGRTATTGCWR